MILLDVMICSGIRANKERVQATERCGVVVVLLLCTVPKFVFIERLDPIHAIVFVQDPTNEKIIITLEKNEGVELYTSIVIVVKYCSNSHAPPPTPAAWPLLLHFLLRNHQHQHLRHYSRQQQDTWCWPNESKLVVDRPNLFDKWMEPLP